MAHQVQQKTSLKQIFFDNGQAYVFGKIPKEKYRVVDQLGRTNEERKFLDAFVKIFIAATHGDLKKCQVIVEEEKFSDIDAYSVGRFRDQNKEPLDYMSPRQIAKLSGYTNITDYFISKFGVLPETSTKTNIALNLTKQDAKKYEDQKKAFKDNFAEQSVEIVLYVIRSKISVT
jgi:hypothetical protein